MRSSSSSSTRLLERLCRHMLLVACALAFSSCAVFRIPGDPRYHAGVANPTGYEPEGTLEECVYSCSVKGPSSRRMLVYLPKGYHDTGKRYPVLYLFHGARGYETSWVKNGRMLEITDSLVREGLAEPCIVVMTNMNQYRDDKDYDGSRYKSMVESVLEIDGAVESSFMNDVVSYVDSHYNTIDSKEMRAVAGLSLGGLQSMNISANNPRSFAYVGLFSPVCGVIRKPGPYSSFYRARKKKQSVQFSEEEMPLGYYVYVGTKDIVYPQVKMYRKYLDRKGYPYEFTLTDGNHDWPYWKAYYIDMLQRIFK